MLNPAPPKKKASLLGVTFLDASGALWSHHATYSGDCERNEKDPLCEARASERSETARRFGGKDWVEVPDTILLR